MSTAFVADASVGFAWAYPNQASAETDGLLQQVESGSAIVIPSFWFLEVANALLAAERRKLLTLSERKTALQKLSKLTYTVEEIAISTAFGKISELAGKHGLSVYDAAYLELALRRKLPLASRDVPLRKAAKANGVVSL